MFTNNVADTMGGQEKNRLMNIRVVCEVFIVYKLINGTVMNVKRQS